MTRHTLQNAGKGQQIKELNRVCGSILVFPEKTYQEFSIAKHSLKRYTLFKANYRTAPQLTVLIKLVIAANWIFTIYLTPFANLTIKKDIIWNAFYFFKK